MASPALSRLIAKLFVRPPSRRDRRAARLGVERLEARDVPAVTFAIEKLSDATEGGAAGQFRVTATGDASDFTNAVYAYWTATGGTASPTNDYTTTPGTGTYLIFNASGATATVTITAVDDPDTEGDETVVLAVQRYIMYPIGTPSTGTLTIHDNDAPSPPPPSPPPPSPPPPPPPLPVVSVTRVNDAVEGGQLGYFRFARSGPTTDTLAANYIVRTIGPGYADPGDDYTTLSESVTFLPGMATADVAVEAHQDGWAEYPETVDVLVTEGSGYEPSAANALVWIWDDYSLLPPEVSVSALADAVEGGAVGILRFSRTGSIDDPLVVTYTLATGADEATPGDDYALLSGEVTFPIGKAFVDVTVAAVDDEYDEETERVTATVHAPSGYVVGAQETGVVRIADTDGPPGTELGVIGGLVWDDAISDGVRAVGEARRADFPVTLRDSSGTDLFTILTAADGSYAFGGLQAGEYTVSFGSPASEGFTDQDEGSDDAVDSDANPVTGLATPVNVVAGALVQLGVDAGLITALPGPSILIADAKGLPTSAARVAKWWYAFSPSGAGGKAELLVPDAKGDFIDANDDRYYVWVRDPVRWSNEEPHVEVRVSSSNTPGNGRWNDPGTAIPLVRVAAGPGGSKAGWYVSDSQFLVSNAADDTHNDSRVGVDDINVSFAPNAPRYVKGDRTFPLSDRTHRIALGGAFVAEYDTGGSTPADFRIITASAVVPVEKVVKVHIAVLEVTSKVGGTVPSHSKADVDEDLAVARETYAQVGIQIELVGIDYAAPQPEGVNLVDGLQGGGNDGMEPAPLIVPTAEEQSLLGDPGLWADDPTGVIHVYYVNTLEPDDGVKGQAFARPALAMGYQIYDASVVIGDVNTLNGLGQVNGRKRVILAHEMFHIMESRPTYDAVNVPADHFPYGGSGGKGPEFNTLNLMWHGRGGSYTSSIRDQVRLTNEQHCYVLCSRPDILSDP